MQTAAQPGEVHVKMAKKGRSVMRSLQSGVDAPVDQSSSHWVQIAGNTLPYGVFAVVVDDISTLLSLLHSVTANLYQGLDYPVKCIEVVIVHNQTHSGFINDLNISLQILKDAGIFLHRKQHWIGFRQHTSAKVTQSL